MRQLWLIAILLAGVAVVTAVSPLSGWQLTGTARVPPGALALGTVELPRSVLANGRALSAGAYELHLTAYAAIPETNGALRELERWVEFRQDGRVRGREVVTIVPEAEIGEVAETSAPGSGSSRVDMLRGNDYLRVWVNRGGAHYLLHLAVG